MRKLGVLPFDALYLAQQKFRVFKSTIQWSLQNLLNVLLFHRLVNLPGLTTRDFAVLKTLYFLLRHLKAIYSDFLINCGYNECATVTIPGYKLE